MSEIEDLSSLWTWPLKRVFAPFWIVVFGSGAVATALGVMHDRNGGPAPLALRVVFPLVWVAGGAYLWRWTSRLVRVHREGEALLVSDYRREIRVPFEELESVTEHRWQRGRPITLRFFHDTEFGREVVFLPKAVFWSWDSHETTKFLEAVARRNTRGLE